MNEGINSPVYQNINDIFNKYKKKYPLLTKDVFTKLTLIAKKHQEKKKISQEEQDFKNPYIEVMLELTLFLDKQKVSNKSKKEGPNVNNIDIDKKKPKVATGEDSRELDNSDEIQNENNKVYFTNSIEVFTINDKGERIIDPTAPKYNKPKITNFEKKDYNQVFFKNIENSKNKKEILKNLNNFFNYYNAIFDKLGLNFEDEKENLLKKLKESLKKSNIESSINNAPNYDIANELFLNDIFSDAIEELKEKIKNEKDLSKKEKLDTDLKNTLDQMRILCAGNKDNDKKQKGEFKKLKYFSSFSNWNFIKYPTYIIGGAITLAAAAAWGWLKIGWNILKKGWNISNVGEKDDGFSSGIKKGFLGDNKK